MHPVKTDFQMPAPKKTLLFYITVGENYF